MLKVKNNTSRGVKHNFVIFVYFCKDYAYAVNALLIIEAITNCRMIYKNY